MPQSGHVAGICLIGCVFCGAVTWEVAIAAGAAEAKAAVVEAAAAVEATTALDGARAAGESRVIKCVIRPAPPALCLGPSRRARLADGAWSKAAPHLAGGGAGVGAELELELEPTPGDSLALSSPTLSLFDSLSNHASTRLLLAAESKSKPLRRE
jgi:hypothetical protein